MPNVTSHAPGTPSWVDLATPDAQASTAFYTALFGWVAEPSPDAAAGGYVRFTKDGESVAGLQPRPGGESPASWSTYVSVTDADRTAKAASAAGGTVIAEPFDVLDAGRMSIVVDPFGAFISLWQPKDHIGATLIDEPGAFCLAELATRDIEGAKEFYRGTFDWNADTTALVDTSYTVFTIAGRKVAAMIQMNDDWPPSIPPHWMVYFAVEHTDTIAARVKELGGTVSVPPTAAPTGRFAVVDGPEGAVFSIIERRSA